MAYIDERADGFGSDDEQVFLCLHGQPTWSFLYRRMIPVLLHHSTLKTRPSRRVIAPDLFGFGRSDKPTRDSDYTFNFHRDALLHFVKTLDLRNITLVVQDWGGVLGLTLPIAFPERFQRFIVMNTSLAVGTPPTKGFLEWRAYNKRTPDMDIAALMKRSCPHLTKAEADAYSAPYPSIEYKGGVRRFPNLVMTDPSMEGADTSRECAKMYATSDQWKMKDVFMACGCQDPVLGPPVMRSLARMWRNGCNFVDIEEAGHFTQEWGDRIARLAIEVFEQSGDVEGIKKVRPSTAKF